MTVSIMVGQTGHLSIFIDNLKTGTYNGVRCSSIYDYVKNEPAFKNINLYTDGIYEWDDEEIYHFEHYNMKLDDEFIKHILNN